jgi:hypothetical protein
VRGRDAIVRAETPAPIERLKIAAFVDAESIGSVAAIEAEDLLGRLSLGCARNS